jgi:DNA-binding transcriptional MerR regulator
MELLSIGRFARLSGLTVRAVRHYGEIGLLEPAYVDPETGYRYFAAEQVADAEAIRRMRFLELGLDEIREILAADDPTLPRTMLLSHRAKMAELAASTEQILTTLQKIIEGEEELVPTTADIRDEVEVKEVPEQPALVIRDRVLMEKLPEIIPSRIDEIHGHMQTVGATFTGPPFIVCPYPDDEGLVDLETGWPVDGTFPGEGRVELATLRACTVVSYMHRGHYAELGRSYRALEAFLEREGLTRNGPAREIYPTSPQEVEDPADWLTEVQFPIVRDEARIAALTGATTRQS